MLPIHPSDVDQLRFVDLFGANAGRWPARLPSFGYTSASRPRSLLHSV